MSPRHAVPAEFIGLAWRSPPPLLVIGPPDHAPPPMLVGEELGPIDPPPEVPAIPGRRALDEVAVLRFQGPVVPLQTGRVEPERKVPHRPEGIVLGLAGPEDLEHELPGLPPLEPPRG